MTRPIRSAAAAMERLQQTLREVAGCLAGDEAKDLPMALRQTLIIKIKEALAETTDWNAEKF